MALIYLQRGDVAAGRRRLGNFPELLRADLLREPENSRVLRYLGTVEAILVKVGDKVKIAWTWEERRRIEQIEAVHGK